MKWTFGEILADHQVAIIFGNGVNALIGRVKEVHDNYLVIERKHTYVSDKGETFHVPFASIAYVRLDD